jgi:hypothetical protein
MELDNLRTILNQPSCKGNHQPFLDLQAQLPREKIVDMLSSLLGDTDSHVRFFSLYYLIDIYRDFLAQANEELTEKIYRLIFDEDVTVVDRAIWALGITGDTGLTKLIKEYPLNSILKKSRIITAIGRGGIGHKTKARFDFLLDAIHSKDERLRFYAMCEIMSNSSVSPWKKNYDADINFSEIYATVLPTAQDFSNSTSKTHREFADRYIDWISTKS